MALKSRQDDRNCGGEKTVNWDYLSKDVNSVTLFLPAAPARPSEPAAHFQETLRLSASAGHTHTHTYTCLTLVVRTPTLTQT